VTARVRYGVRGWQRLEGFYPPRTKPAGMLASYAAVCHVVEADNTFSGVPKPERMLEWVHQTPPDFRFDVVAFGGLTLYQRRPGDSGPVGRRSWTEVAVPPPEILFDDFAASIRPLHDAGRLGAIILQLAPWFEAGTAAREYLSVVRARLPGLPLAVELRHPTWSVPSHQEPTLELLIDLGVGWVVADYPPAQPEWTPPVVAATVDGLAVIRLHGRNAEAWARSLSAPVDANPFEYSDEDLRPWVAHIRALAHEVAEVHVLVGTAPQATALQTARRLEALVTEASNDAARWGVA